MKLSADQLQAKGFAYYRAPAAAGVGRTFDAVAKTQGDFEVVAPVSSSTASRSYSPPIAPVRGGANIFQAVADLRPSGQAIDVYA